jgi:signal transduction histidine kinase
MSGAGTRSIEEENALLQRELQTARDELAATRERLREAEERLIAQDRLAALGSLTAGIAHELRNPLNFVKSFSHLSVELLQELAEGLEASSHLQGPLGDLKLNLGKIQEHGQRMEVIIRAMLEHSRGGKGERQDTELNTLVSSHVNLAYHGMRSRDASFNTAITLELDPSVGMVPLVPEDLGRVIVNLLDNACHAVRTRQRAHPGGGFQGRIQVRTRNLGDRVELRIHDNGTGIPRRIREKLFTPFFTTKRTGEGTGLGLSLSHDIVVKDHGGTLRFESEEGAFTEFIITLPSRPA